MEKTQIQRDNGMMAEAQAPVIKHHDNRDKGQRQFWGCMVSKDIGEYNTCPHLCEYCYANASKKKAQENYNKHEMNPLGKTITV